MHALVYEVGVRIVAFVLAIHFGRELWRGLRDGSIEYAFDSVLDLLLPTTVTYRRDVMPVRYWIEVGSRAAGVLACVYVMVLGWPTT